MPYIYLKTNLFNLHEIQVNGDSVFIEFYAGNIFDVYSDILLLSAYKGMFFPTEGTTWGSLKDRTGITVTELSADEKERISNNILSFTTPKNRCFEKLVAFEMSELNKPGSFTQATLITRFKELVSFLENYPSEETESISLPLLGTGNQGLSLEDSVTELLNAFKKLKQTNLKIIRVFAMDFESIGILNKKINELLTRKEISHPSLLKTLLNKAQQMLNKNVSMLTSDTITNLISLAQYDHFSLDVIGIKGRVFAEKVCAKLLQMHDIELEKPSSLENTIKGLSDILKKDKQTILSHLRLLQTYGNQTAHDIAELDEQDTAAIIISMMKVMDYYEYKLKSSNNHVELNGAEYDCR